ncbi:MAG: GNAT family N-acetyltransferase [Candidatus Levybacteria bacterium]|nr:GNAT family N-acetyltransferase [Candidatus Levybacteria bacterium]
MPQIGQLVGFSSKDSLVRKFTSDTNRFKDRKVFDSWIAKGKRIWVLTDNNENLLGIIWIGDSILPEADFTENIDREVFDKTIAIRLYVGARGKGIAYDFSKKVLDLVDEKRLWISVREGNLAARKLYEKLGFQEITKPTSINEEGKILLILD